MKEITLDATVENIAVVTDFINEILEDASCPMAEQMVIDIALDEVLANIAFYAYTPEVGPVTVRAEIGGDPRMVEITFIDRGIPYNPLEKEDPDTTLSAEERNVGGLGIFLVKQSMDEIDYKHVDGQNVLTIKKKI